MSQVLVTGAGGFLGSHLCEALLRAGHQVTALVHAPAGMGWLAELAPELRAELNIISGDIRDAVSLRALLKGKARVFHLVNLPASGSLLQAHVYVETHVTGTLNLLHAALAQDNCQVIHVSSAEVYGTPLYQPVDEKHPLQGRSPYLASKVAADMLAESFYRSFQLNLTIARFFPLIGPRQPDSALVPWIYHQLHNPEQATLRLPSLTASLDLSPVENALSALLHIASRNVAGEVIHFGAGREIALVDLAHQIMQNIGIEKPLQQGLTPGLTPIQDQLQANLEKAQRILGWVPCVDFQQGLQKTLHWLSQRQRTTH